MDKSLHGQEGVERGAEEKVEIWEAGGHSGAGGWAGYGPSRGLVPGTEWKLRNWGDRTTFGGKTVWDSERLLAIRSLLLAKEVPRTSSFHRGSRKAIITIIIHVEEEGHMEAHARKTKRRPSWNIQRQPISYLC